MKDNRGLIEIANFIGDIYNRNTKSADPKNYLICHKYAIISSYLIWTTIITYIFIISAVLLPSMWQFIFTGKMSPPARLYLPVIVDQSGASWAFLIILNYSLGVLAGLILIPFDGLIYLIFANIPMLTLIITTHIAEFNKYIAKPKKAFKYKQSKLLIIILMSLKYNEEIDNLFFIILHFMFLQLIFLKKKNGKLLHSQEH